MSSKQNKTLADCKLLAGLSFMLFAHSHFHCASDGRRLKICLFVLQEGLLDRHEFLSWIIDNVDKTKQVEDTICKMVLKELLMVMFCKLRIIIIVIPFVGLKL